MYNYVYIYYFTEKHFAEAIDCYTKAIEINPSVAVYYGNRSFAHMKLENYGFALNDASKALELDKTYIKVCSCNIAIVKCEALNVILIV